MAESKDAEQGGEGRGGGRALLAGAFALALGLGGAAFYGAQSGLIVLPFLDRLRVGEVTESGAAPAAAYTPGAYVQLDTLVISLGPESRADHLKVGLVIEAEPGRADEVEAVMPRLVDVLNVFLRAVDERDFEVPRSMERLRAQMLRRVQLVAPEGAVRDLLIQEFVLN